MWFKKGRSQISNIILQFKELEKEEQNKYMFIRKKEIIKIRVGINKIDRKKLTKPRKLSQKDQQN